MAQTGHPYSSQVKASQRRRLAKLGARAGKPFGHAAMQQKKSYPKKNAGTEREMTIAGGSGTHRADRMASGGSVKRHKPPHTTNIIISHAGGQGGRGGVGAGGVGAAPGGARPPLPPPAMPLGAGASPPAMPPRPMGMPMGGGMPIGARPPIAPPVGGAGLPPRPLGMKTGGGVKKRRAGGPLSPTTDAEQRDQRSPGETIPAQRKRSGGAVRKLQMGGPAAAGATNPIAGLAGGLAGGAGTRPTPVQPGIRTISGRPARPATPLAVPMPNTLAAQRFMPAPGTTTGFKKGGEVHGDEAEDRKLFGKMMHEREAKKRKRGGHVGPHATPHSVLSAPKYHDEGVGKRAAGGFVPTRQESEDPGLAGTKYHQQGRGFKGGGYVDNAPMGPHMPGSAAGGLGRLEKTKMAGKVPAKTED